MNARNKCRPWSTLPANRLRKAMLHLVVGSLAYNEFGDIEDGILGVILPAVSGLAWPRAYIFEETWSHFDIEKKEGFLAERATFHRCASETVHRHGLNDHLKDCTGPDLDTT